METVYIETTVVSYLVANPSRDSILAAHQQLTRQWWQDERQRYHCVTSSEVWREASLGDAEMSRRRMEALAGRGARLYIPREDQDYAFGVGLRMLTLRRIVVEEDGLYRAAAGEGAVLDYYANAIGHLAMHAT